MARKILLQTIICGVLALCITHTQAATIKHIGFKGLSSQAMDGGKCNILLSGPIRKGDQARLDAYWEANKAKFQQGWGWGMGWSICLDSQGGDYLEGVKLAEYFAKQGFGTVIPRGARCLSACAIAFMGGTLEDEGSTSALRTMHVGAQLGFHRPYLNIPKGDYRESTVVSAYTTAVVAIKRFLRFAITGSYENSGNRARVKASLVEEFLGFDRNSMFYIDNLDKAGRWEIGLHGYRPQEVSVKGLMLGCVNMHLWHEQDQSAIPKPRQFEGFSGPIESLREGTVVKDQKHHEGYSTITFTLGYEMGSVVDCTVIRREGGVFGYQYVVNGRRMPLHVMRDPSIKIKTLR